ncbi:DEAD/DEAH box helicase [Hoeflea sp.]|uniref:DEAD/DEAH box helicase n=1 Tax=Hoeflea sp. TaxID=1940281 RepID=UPI0019BE2AA3|nr:DEAD/DEAH box helicase [Hoeflea sp.]MBC7282617.1 DEAD/DEAH box helicase [Hoeflea sp.]
MNDMFRGFDRREDLAKKKELREHQVRAIGMLRRSMGRAPLGLGNKRVVLQAPTGAGKTLISAKLIEGALAKENRVIFTAPAISLIDQTVAAFEAEGITGIGVLQASHPRTDPLARVQVASVQTLAKRDIPAASMVIVDECHLRAKVIERLMSERPDVYFIGLSATPWAKGMGLLWQDLVIPTSIGDLIERGYLSRFRVFAPDVPDMSGVKTVAGDYDEGQTAEVMSGKTITASVVETWLERGEGRPTLLFAVNRAHAKQLFEAFERAGVASAYVDAYTDVVERQIIERRFRSGEVKIACSVRTLTTGIDWPVGCIVDAAPTKSEMLHVQRIGRGLRVNPGIDGCLILDHAGNSLRLGLVTDIRHERLDDTAAGPQKTRAQADKLPKPCPGCGELLTGLQCQSCGFLRKPVSGVEVVEGELVEIAGKKAAPTREEKQAWWSGLLSVAKHRGRAKGWASHTYRDRFGVWPKGLDYVLGEVTPEMWNYVKAKDIRFAKRRQNA